MASAIGTVLISTILPRMAAKAMLKVKAMVDGKVDGIVNIQRDISNLQTTLSMIEGIVDIVDIDDDFIRNWLHDLNDVSYEARDVLEDFITFSSCINTTEEASNPVKFFSSFMLSCFGGPSSDTSKHPLAVLNRLEKDIRSLRERFDEKKKEGKTFATLKSVPGGGSESVRVDSRSEVEPSINRDALFLGRKEVKEGIMEKILNPNYDNRVRVVAIWGMGGIGKTTLAQSIYNDERVVKKVPRSGLYVGENKFSAGKVIREILNEKETIGIGNLQKKLVEKFSGDRFLIVLDDVWDVDGSEWDLLFNPLTNVGKGGLIIITTRKRDVCTATNTQMIYDLTPLSKEDSWSIFESCAYVNGKSDSTPELKGIGKQIVKNLNGLPLALKVVGCFLLRKDSSIWTNFLESKFRKDNEVMSVLRWSYKHLPRHLKTCFTYCALFPKGHVFDNEKVLVEMWMAHDLIQKEEQKRPEDVGAQYFQELVNASLLQCVDGKYVMHDLIHDLALLVSNGEFASANSSLTDDQMKKVRHITRDYSKIPRLYKIEKLLTMYTIWSYENDRNYSVLDDVFKKLKNIRVLVLSGEWIKKIPDCISGLKHLRYLDVSKTEVKILPDSLCHLYNLQMIAAPPDVVLPRDIVKMVNLRYIRAILSTCKGVGKLTTLQELSSIHVCEGDDIRELGDMQELRGKLRIKGLENVEKLEDDVGTLMGKQKRIDELELVFDKQLEKSTISEEVLDALGCPPNLTYLKIVGYYGVKSPRWMVDGKHKFDKLQTLELFECPKLESLPPLEKLTSLKHICLCNVGVKRFGDKFYGKVFFPSLESLRFCEMHEWVEWNNIIIKNSSVSFFPRLTRLEIKHCAKLETIGFERLPSLKHLDVNCCNKLISIPCLVGIKYLNLYGCERLRSLSINIHGLDSLEHLHINGCPTLELAFEDESSSSSSSGNSVAVPIHNISTDNTKVFGKLLHHEIVSLESLSIRKLEGFKNFGREEANNFCKFRSLRSLRILQCEDLKSLPADFHKLSSLKTLEINDCSQFQSLPSNFHMLSSLERLYILSCPQLQSWPENFHKLSSLESLCIEYCPQLQSLPDNGSPFLRDLTIEGCPLLYERCKDGSGLDWHKIKHIRWKRITTITL